VISRTRVSAVLTLLFFGLKNSAFAATCSCAGVPLLTLIDTSATEKGQLFISYSAEDHQINDLVSGTDDVNDETGRDRNSFSQVISASYALTDRWSFSALTSYVDHSRKIGTSSIGKTTSSGFGDSVFLARYTPFFITPFSRHEFSVGLGVRIPTGEDNYKTDNGITVSEDMQPSTGAYGTILWSSYSYAFNQAGTLQATVSSNYTWNEENDRRYTFGDEFSFAIGVGQSIGTRFGYSAALRYRATNADRRADFSLPNTGGKWLDFVPAVQYTITDNFRASLFGRLPLARDLDGVLQFTTSYSVGVSLSYGF
jgi:hypothetical protein